MRFWGMVRHISTSTVLKDPPNLVKMKRIQAKFQCEDGLCIWEKNGLPDKILYYTTIISVWVGMAMTLCLVYDYAKPQSWGQGKSC